MVVASIIPFDQPKVGLAEHGKCPRKNMGLVQSMVKENELRTKNVMEDKLSNTFVLSFNREDSLKQRQS